MKIGMILEGGAMRGLYTAGVLDVFLEENINVDGYIGVSAGAVFGCNYKSKQAERVLRYNTKYIQDSRYMSIKSLIKTGDYFGVDFLYHKIPESLDPFDYETFKKNPIDFYVVCSDIDTGKPYYHHCQNGYDDLLYMQASASMPLVSNIVTIDGHHYLDGGMTDSIPLSYFQSIGYQKNIVILTQPKHYRKKKNKLIPLITKKYKDYPKLIEAMKNRHVLYNQTVEEIENKDDEMTYVIQPSKPLPIKRTSQDPIALNEAYYLGRQDAYKHLNEIKEFIKV